MPFPSGAIPARKAYLRSSSASSATTSQVVMAELVDFTFTVEEDNIDVTSHDSSGWVESIIGLRRASWDANANYLSTGVGQGALRQSLIDGDATLYVSFQATTSPTAKKFQAKTRLTAFTMAADTQSEVKGSFRGVITGPVVRTA